MCPAGIAPIWGLARRAASDRIGSDYAHSAPEGKLSVLEIRWDCRDMTGTANLPRLVGPTRQGAVWTPQRDGEEAPAWGSPRATKASRPSRTQWPWLRRRGKSPHAIRRHPSLIATVRFGVAGGADRTSQHDRSRSATPIR